jgi:hypothetical protein
MLLSEEALHRQDPVLYGTPGPWLWSVCPSLKEAPSRRSVVRASRESMDTSTVCRGVSERARSKDNRS